MTRPDSTEAAASYFKYIDQVPDGEVRAVLERQRSAAPPFLGSISEQASLHRYAPDKWSIRQVLNHVNDTERVFLFRALWFARGFEDPLPSFDEKVSAGAAAADDVSWASHVEEFLAIRSATVSFFRNLPAGAWSKKGVASGNPVSVNALAWIAAGHYAHHLAVLEEKYLPFV